jgi:MraZ protein
LNKELAKINSLNRYKAKNVRFMRQFLTGVKQANPDASDRILIPKELMEVAGLKKEVVLAPLIDRMEIWDKTKYEEMISKMDNEEFQGLAEEVMDQIEQEEK